MEVDKSPSGNADAPARSGRLVNRVFLSAFPHEPDDQGGPSGLVTGPETFPGLGVKILVKQHEILPVRMIIVAPGNAGIADMALTWDITEEWWDTMLDVNLKGYWLAVKYVVPHMLARNTGGRIIMTSSVAGLRGEPGMAHYCASKWGVIGLAKTLAHELAKYNITVNTLHPTAVDTDIITGMAQAAEMSKEELVDFIFLGHMMPVKLIDADDVAKAALWLASDEARFITGQTMKIDAGRMLK
ncbi:MAG: SDR family oxidoreductase [Candidatus Competibacteraceae bacterium]|nr:SDR family oxidoreductase [Candidatus Competibacteraceae bacterium]